MSLVWSLTAVVLNLYTSVDQYLVVKIFSKQGLQRGKMEGASGNILVDALQSDRELEKKCVCLCPDWMSKKEGREEKQRVPSKDISVNILHK